MIKESRFCADAGAGLYRDLGEVLTQLKGVDRNITRHEELLSAATIVTAALIHVHGRRSSPNFRR
jgi:hypothetical protein